MDATNTNTLSMLTRLLPAFTGVFLVFGISLVVGGSTVTLQGQLVTDDAFSPVVQTLDVNGVTQAPELHQAALPDISETDQAGRILFIGMLMILSALLLYTMYVVRLQREAMERTPWHRMARWFERHLHPSYQHMQW